MLGVTAATVHRWTEAGVLQAHRTVGGHRRYTRSHVERIIRERSLGPAQSSSGPRILLASPSPETHLVCRNALTDKPYELNEVNSGHEALIEMAQNKPDILLLDLDMKEELDSLLVLREVAKRWPDITILVLATPEQSDKMLKALEFSPFHVVGKPINPSVLQKAVHAFIRPLEIGPERTTDDGLTRILIVDDDEPVRTGLEAELGAEAQFRVRTASNGYQAGRLLCEFRPHVVILDLMMEGLNGFDVCRDIRATPELKNTRVLVLTGYPGGGNTERALACGADTVLSKPTSTARIKEQLRKLLKQV